LNHSTADNPQDRAELRAIERIAQARTDRTEHPTRYPRPDSIEEDRWRVMVAEELPTAHLHYFMDPQAARAAMEERLAMGGEPSLNFWIEGVYIGLALEDEAFARECLEAARKLAPAHPALPDLERLIR
jgi:hypothetical protein